MTDSMNISDENQALSTDTSNKPTPIPPTPNSFPPIAPPTPPSNSQLLNSTTSSRKILKLAIPIKRPIPERPQQKNKNRSDVANAFLPRELAEIERPNFAAVANSPNPPKIPSHSKLTKGSGSGSGRGKNVEKNIPVPIPQIPRPLQTSQNAWVTIARNGQKKARVTPNNNIHITPVSKIRPQKSNKEKSPATPTDKRLFLRLPQEHE
ncbi:hypothetical protein EPUL_005237 [Erysiphe pulchra]|uniref:Uncharacterized protein n=1 Tax=Erysiphe pulchra TaxID=225359 RepID=A0A2S4PLG2_9PEZI|nr:hypothetical protein EPUL_005237 [Erysiphe pulchra]